MEPTTYLWPTKTMFWDVKHQTLGVTANKASISKTKIAGSTACSLTVHPCFQINADAQIPDGLDLRNDMMLPMSQGIIGKFGTLLTGNGSLLLV